MDSAATSPQKVSDEQEQSQDNDTLVMSTPDGQIENNEADQQHFEKVDNIQCGRCHKGFPELLELRQHLFHKECGSENVDRVGVPIYPCNKCGVIFDKESNLKNHQVTTSLDCAEVIEAAAGPNPPPPCPLCGDELISWADYVDHTTDKLCEKYLKCPKCDECIIGINHKSHVSQCFGERICEVCGRICDRLCSLRQHQRHAHGLRILRGEVTAKAAQKNSPKRYGIDYDFRCGRCHEWFPKLLEMRRHLFHKECGFEMVDKLGVAIVPCDKCGVIFDTVKNLEQHQKCTNFGRCRTCDDIIHAAAGPDPPPQCSLCNETFSSWLEYVHHTADKMCETGLKCPKCNEYIIRKKHRKHVLRCTGIRRCRICHVLYSSICHVEKHQAQVHGLGILEGEVTKIDEQNESPKPDNGTDLHYQCGRCHEWLPNMLELRRHLFRKECGSENVDKLGVAINPCDKCWVIFDTVKNLQLHRKSRECDQIIHIAGGPDPPPPCPLCNRHLISWIDYVRHTTNKICQGGINCPICEQLIIGIMYKSHVSQCLGERKCNLCGSNWTTMSELRKHQAVTHKSRYLSGEVTVVKARKSNKHFQSNVVGNEYLEEPEIMNVDARFLCCRCLTTYASKEEVRDHIREKHNIVVEDFIHKESDGAEKNKYKMKGGCSVCHICGLVVMAVEFMCFHLRYCETLHGLPLPDDD